MYAYSQLPAKRIRRLTFFSITVGVTMAAIAIDYWQPKEIDVPMFLYLCTMVLSGACLWLFVDWWWCQFRTATRIYACITLLLLGIGYNSALSVHARSLYIMNDLNDLRSLYASNLWQYRVLPELVVLTYLFSFALARMTSGKDED